MGPFVGMTDGPNEGEALGAKLVVGLSEGAELG